MKTITMIKRVLAAVVLVLACGVSMAATNGQFMYNDQMQDGKLISREVYAKEPGFNTLVPVKMYKFSYDTVNNKTTQTIYEWSGLHACWQEKNLITVSHKAGQTEVEYAAWEPTKKIFVSYDKQIYTTDHNQQLFAGN